MTDKPIFRKHWEEEPIRVGTYMCYEWPTGGSGVYQIIYLEGNPYLGEEPRLVLQNLIDGKSHSKGVVVYDLKRGLTEIELLHLTNQVPKPVNIGKWQVVNRVKAMQYIMNTMIGGIWFGGEPKEKELVFYGELVTAEQAVVGQEKDKTEP